MCLVISESHLHAMKEEVREEFVIIPAQVNIVRHITHHYACINCKKNKITVPIVKSDSPNTLIPKSTFHNNSLHNQSVQKILFK